MINKIENMNKQDKEKLSKALLEAINKGKKRKYYTPEFIVNSFIDNSYDVEKTIKVLGISKSNLEKKIKDFASGLVA